MPKRLRDISSTNIYHVIFKGNRSHDIFFDEMDNNVFLDRMKRTVKNYHIKIYAYCLMNNHVHIVLNAEPQILSRSMQSLAISYSAYFNKKINSHGHIFQNRFFSKKIEDLRYFKEVCKYVHRNPEKAGIALTQDYFWSSYHLYKSSKPTFISTKELLYYFNNNVEEFDKFTLLNDDSSSITRLADFEILNRLDDQNVVNIISLKYNIDNPSKIVDLPIEEKKKILKELLEIQGISLNKLSRLVHITAYQINKILH